MQCKLTHHIFIWCAIISIGCGVEKKKESIVGGLATSKVDTSRFDTVVLKETFNEEDVPVNEYLSERLKPIRANFKRINSIPNLEWSLVLKKELKETAEGGEATYYYYNQDLDKIITHHLGETGQQLNEYYLLRGQLSFVLEKSYNYNRPVSYDSTAMRENNDTEAFDFEESEIIEARSYFDNERLIHQLNSQDCGSPFANDYLLIEQKRIKKDFYELIKLATAK